MIEAIFSQPAYAATKKLMDATALRHEAIASNLANIELRYALAPYYYSLAHRAWRDGEPVFPSLDYYYDDEAAKGIGHEKMIGSELVAAAVAAPGADEVALYLPAGDWYDFRSTVLTQSSGETFTIPTRVADRFELPVFARDGAIIPMADGVLRVFGSAANSFDWYDDDGISTAYQRGDYDHIAVAVDGNRLTLARERGDLMPSTLVWTRAEPVTEVLIGGSSVAFEQERSTLSVKLPAFDRELTIDVR